MSTFLMKELYNGSCVVGKVFKYFELIEISSWEGSFVDASHLPDFYFGFR